jgi:hypothetical protein
MANKNDPFQAWNGSFLFAVGVTKELHNRQDLFWKIIALLIYIIVITFGRTMVIFALCVFVS